MDKSNPLFVKEYPEWKKNLWGAGRAFVAAFIPMFGLMLISVEVQDFESKERLIKLVTSIGLASIVAGIIGLGKFLRDVFPESTLVQRLPI